MNDPTKEMTEELTKLGETCRNVQKGKENGVNTEVGMDSVLEGRGFEARNTIDNKRKGRKRRLTTTAERFMGQVDSPSVQRLAKVAIVNIRSISLHAFISDDVTIEITAVIGIDR